MNTKCPRFILYCGAAKLERNVNVCARAPSPVSVCECLCSHINRNTMVLSTLYLLIALLGTSSATNECYCPDGWLAQELPLAGGYECARVTKFDTVRTLVCRVRRKSSNSSRILISVRWARLRPMQNCSTSCNVSFGKYSQKSLMVSITPGLRGG